MSSTEKPVISTAILFHSFHIPMMRVKQTVAWMMRSPYAGAALDPPSWIMIPKKTLSLARVTV